MTAHAPGRANIRQDIFDATAAINVEVFRTMTFNPNLRSTAEYQAMDAAHHWHPFTDTKELNASGTRVITAADGCWLTVQFFTPIQAEAEELLDDNRRGPSGDRE